MKKAFLHKFTILTCSILVFACGIFAQNGNLPHPKSQETAKTQEASKSQEMDEKENIPVLTKHLPDWENARNRAVYILNTTDLRKALGERPVFDLIDFAGGTEAVTAPYPQGKLLIIEYNTPQASVDADNKIKQRLAEIGPQTPIFYRRIGNYNAFVFDGTEEAAANSLLDQVKYQKNVQWLGTDPFAFKRAERAFIETTSQLFTSTLLAIVGGIGLSILTGIAVGVFFFYLREQRRSTMEAFSDAGGMTRLNLDGLSAQTSSDRLLNE